MVVVVVAIAVVGVVMLIMMGMTVNMMRVVVIMQVGAKVPGSEESHCVSSRRRFFLILILALGVVASTSVWTWLGAEDRRWPWRETVKGERDAGIIDYTGVIVV